MAGQSDASDDLIAELAKLMAQDAKNDRPEQPARPVLPVRIPGGEATPAPAPRFDFGRSSSAAVAEPAAPVAETHPTPAAPPQPGTVPGTPEPFHFDFDLNVAKPTPADADPEPAFVAPAAEPASSAPDHDSIADLIAAELSTDPDPMPESPAEPELPAHSAPSWAPAAAAAAGGAAFAAGIVPPTISDRASQRPLDGAPQRSEPDRFKVAPVFGLASRPASPVERPPSAVQSDPFPAPAPAQVEPTFGWRQSAPAAPVAPPVDDGIGSDPIDDIENLIGRAVQVGLDVPVEPAADEPRAPASPALRSLATPTMPAADKVEHAPYALSGADEAIMAAAQATGVQIGWVEAPEVGDTEPSVAPRLSRAPRALGLTRKFAGPLVAVTLLLAAGFGLYWVLGLGGEEGPAPLLTADATPIKETPEAQPDTAASSQSVVFNEIDGVVPGAEEQLVSRDQADVNEVTQIPPAAGLSEEGLANRKVRTVTVRPDGTIVSGDDSVAGSTILPVDRPNVPAVPGAATASPELQAAVATPAPAVPAPAPEPTVVPVTPGSMVPAVDAAGNPVAGKTAPVPMTRPSGLSSQAPTSPVNAVVNTPAAASAPGSLPPPPAVSTLSPTPAPAPAQPAAAAIPQAVEVDALPNNAPAYVQLASQRSETEARASAQAMVTRFGPLFGGANLEVQRVDLGERGIYYRVRVPANSMQEANSICTNVKAAGGDCFTM
jgi:hypothetical protein